MAEPEGFSPPPVSLEGYRRNARMALDPSTSEGHAFYITREVITNSLDALATRIDISISHDVGSEDRLHTWFCIHDNGSGIPVEKIKELTLEKSKSGKREGAAGTFGRGIKDHLLAATEFEICSRQNGIRRTERMGVGTSTTPFGCIPRYENGTSIKFTLESDVVGENGLLVHLWDKIVQDFVDFAVAATASGG